MDNGYVFTTTDTNEHSKNVLLLSEAISQMFQFPFMSDE